jgi:hypothetical protein
LSGPGASRRRRERARLPATLRRYRRPIPPFGGSRHCSLRREQRWPLLDRARPPHRERSRMDGVVRCACVCADGEDWENAWRPGCLAAAARRHRRQCGRMPDEVAGARQRDVRSLHSGSVLRRSPTDPRVRSDVSITAAAPSTGGVCLLCSSTDLTPAHQSLTKARTGWAHPAASSTLPLECLRGR